MQKRFLRKKCVIGNQLRHAANTQTTLFLTFFFLPYALHALNMVHFLALCMQLLAPREKLYIVLYSSSSVNKQCIHTRTRMCLRLHAHYSLPHVLLLPLYISLAGTKLDERTKGILKFRFIRPYPTNRKRQNYFYRKSLGNQ